MFSTGQHADSQERAVSGTVILYEMLGTRVCIDFECFQVGSL